MNIDPQKFQTDESRSNPMVVAQQYPDCPINGICMFIAIGFGSVVDQCNHLKIEGETAECLYERQLD